MWKNAKKLHFQCNFSTHITVYVECIYGFLQNLVVVAKCHMLIVDKHCSNVCCDEFPEPQTDRKSKQVKEQ